MISVTCALPAAYVRAVVSMRTYSEGMVLTPRLPTSSHSVFLTTARTYAAGRAQVTEIMRRPPEFTGPR
ncbi:hypothetical protein EAO68_14110 [Streptomyces sp. wa22]|nr:hypothetical protein EAO68_14110 [Streptomyces sp. wa22]